MLLDGGARADIARRVCYPVAHHLKPAVGARKPARFQCRVALRVPASPVAYAIPNDRHEVLQVLLTHRASRDVIKKDFLVHEACKFRAKRCLRILVACLPEQVKHIPESLCHSTVQRTALFVFTGCLAHGLKLEQDMCVCVCLSL